MLLAPSGILPEEILKQKQLGKMPSAASRFLLGGAYGLERMLALPFSGREWRWWVDLSLSFVAGIDDAG